MFKFDESFLETIGLASMPEDQKGEFLEYAQDQLETRIGEKMSQDLSVDQLAEFVKIIDNDQDAIQSVLTSIGDGYKDDETYKKILQNSDKVADSPEMMVEFATAKWLEKNCPQYQQIIKDVIESLSEEIANQKDAILDNA